MHNRFGVMRVINARIWFLTRGTGRAEYLPLCSDTYSTDDREKAYSKARQVSGLMVEIPNDHPSSQKQHSEPEPKNGREVPKAEPGEGGELVELNEQSAAIQRSVRMQLLHDLRDQLAGGMKAAV